MATEEILDCGTLAQFPPLLRDLIRRNPGAVEGAVRDLAERFVTEGVLKPAELEALGHVIGGRYEDIRRLNQQTPAADRQALSDNRPAWMEPFSRPSNPQAFDNWRRSLDITPASTPGTESGQWRMNVVVGQLVEYDRRTSVPRDDLGHEWSHIQNLRTAYYNSHIRGTVDYLSRAGVPIVSVTGEGRHAVLPSAFSSADNSDGRTVNFMFMHGNRTPARALAPIPDADGNPMLGADGNPILAPAPVLDAEGNPTYDRVADALTRRDNLGRMELADIARQVTDNAGGRPTVNITLSCYGSPDQRVMSNLAPGSIFMTFGENAVIDAIAQPIDGSRDGVTMPDLSNAPPDRWMMAMLANSSTANMASNPYEPTISVAGYNTDGSASIISVDGKLQELRDNPGIIDIDVAASNLEGIMTRERIQESIEHVRNNPSSDRRYEVYAAIIAGNPEIRSSLEFGYERINEAYPQTQTPAQETTTPETPAPTATSETPAPTSQTTAAVNPVLARIRENSPA